MNASHYDVIVIGTGSMGSSACYYLAKQGLRVLGLEQFTIPNENASHSGQSRIIRKAYFEHPDYVPLLEKAYQNWKGLESITGEKVYFKTGLVYYGPGDHPMIEGVKRSADLYKIPLQLLKSFREFELPAQGEVLFEPDAGFLLPHKSIELFVQQAKAKAAVIRAGEKVIDWNKKGETITVITDRSEFSCDKLVITAGAWTGKFFPGLANRINVTRQLLIWMRPDEPERYLPENFPCWIIADEGIDGVLYGFPYLDSKKFGAPEGLKAAIHFPDQVFDPDNVNRSITETEKEKLFEIIRRYLPGMKEVVAAKTCLYANSPDENFIIDHLPGYDKEVVVACGFSGHGFKFVSVVGEILADLTIKGKTEVPIKFLSLDRFK